MDFSASLTASLKVGDSACGAEPASKAAFELRELVLQLEDGYWRHADFLPMPGILQMALDVRRRHGRREFGGGEAR